jgi:predicted DNA-binding ribbon-helix-helix protein
LERLIEQAELEKQSLFSESESASREKTALLLALETEKSIAESHTQEISRLIKAKDEGESNDKRLLTLILRVSLARYLVQCL